MMAGANPAAVQRILRHSDPRITTEVYGHLTPGYLKEEVNRLSFDAPSIEKHVVAPLAESLVTPLLPAKGLARFGAYGPQAEIANSSRMPFPTDG
jgi:hypothetical protein